MSRCIQEQYVGKGNTAEDAAATDFSIVWRIISLSLFTLLPPPRDEEMRHTCFWAAWLNAFLDVY
jgi:hypothetical protein